MIGGIVIGLVRREDGALLHVQDRPPHQYDCCSVRVEEKRVDDGAPVQINLGDEVWWQCGNVYWTPSGVRSQGDPQGCGKRWDVALKKIGYSH